METRWFDISRWATRFAWFLVFVAAPRASGACAYQLSAASKYHGAGTASATVNVTAGSGCAWSVTHTNDWITLTSAPTDTGNGNVNYKLSANPQPTRRIGVLTIAGELFTVIQWGTNCESIIAPTSQDRCFGTTTGVVSVTTSSTCGWNVVNSNSWVLITGGASGTGIGKVFYTVISNQTPVARSGVVTIGGQPFSLRQAGFPLHCATNKTAVYGTAWDFDTPIPSDPDNSNLVIQVLSTGTNTLGACGHGYTATRVWQATDRCANSALCAQIRCWTRLNPS